MKKIITTFMMAAMMAVMVPLMSGSATAQTRRYYDNDQRYSNTYKKPSVYKRHRNLINIGIGTAAGAIIGGLIGGKKGALIGTAVGAGGSALYTYKLNPKSKKYEKVYNRNNRNYRRY